MQNQKDPVCGMTVSDDAEALKTEYAGRTYLFCSESCRGTFEMEPERFAIQAGINDGRQQREGTGGM